MKRRSFLGTSLGASLALSGMSLRSGIQAQALTAAPTLGAINTLTSSSDKILVLIQLDGGNDGLNTVIPIENQTYFDKRGTLAIAKSSALVLPDRQTLALHTQMTGMKQLYDNGMMRIIEGVTYPNPNLSHFRGTDIWMTATDSNVFLGSGWIGRYLETLYPQYPDVLSADPPAIQIGATNSLGFMGDKGGMSIAFKDPQEFYNLVGQNGSSVFPPAPNTYAGSELDFVRSIALASQVYSKRVKTAADAGANKATYPTSDLGQSLKICAQLISGGLGTQFYLVSLKGFDTHVTQATVHGNLLADLSNSIKAFFDDLQQLGLADKVAAMTFSEFGRRVEANGSAGTDHGSAAPLMVFGTSVEKGVLGKDPDLTNLDSRGNLQMQYDFRSVYASVLAQWFGIPTTEIQKILFKDFTAIPIFKQNASSVEDSSAHAELLGMSITPNPMTNGTTTLRYTLPKSAFVTIEILDARGTVVARPHSEAQQAGAYEVPCSLSVASGTYFVSLTADRMKAMMPLQVVR